MNIRVMPFLHRKGNKVGLATIDFSDESQDCVLHGLTLRGFTIVDDPSRGGLFVLFPSAKMNTGTAGTEGTYFFLKADTPEDKDRLESRILDKYEKMLDAQKEPFNPAVSRRIDKE